MASESMVRAALNGWAVDWPERFDLANDNGPRILAAWLDALAPFSDAIVEAAVMGWLDDEEAAKFPPKTPDIRARCRALTPRPPRETPEYLDELAGRDPVATAQAKAFKDYLYSKDEYREQIKQAKEGMKRLLDALRAARDAGDDAARVKAEAAIAAARSPSAYRAAQVRALDAKAPERSETLTFPAVCPMCQGHGYVLVYHGQSVPDAAHWVAVPRGPNEPGNTVGTLYYCPRCVTPSRERQRRVS